MIIALDIILWRLNGGDVLEIRFLRSHQERSQKIKSLFLIFRFLTLIFWIRYLIHDSVAKHDFGESKTNPYLIPIQRNRNQHFFYFLEILKILIEFIKWKFHL